MPLPCHCLEILVPEREGNGAVKAGVSPTAAETLLIRFGEPTNPELGSPERLCFAELVTTCLAGSAS